MLPQITKPIQLAPDTHTYEKSCYSQPTNQQSRNFEKNLPEVGGFQKFLVYFFPFNVFLVIVW